MNPFRCPKARALTKHTATCPDNENAATAVLGAIGAIRLTLPILTPSQNVYNEWHWAKRHKWTKQVEMLIGAMLRRSGWTKPAEPALMSVEIVRYSSGTLDEGNLVGGAKGLIDALVRLGVLYDDSPRWCRIAYRQARGAPQKGRTDFPVSQP